MDVLLAAGFVQASFLDSDGVCSMGSFHIKSYPEG